MHYVLASVAALTSVLVTASAQEQTVSASAVFPVLIPFTNTNSPFQISVKATDVAQVGSRSHCPIPKHQQYPGISLTKSKFQSEASIVVAAADSYFSSLYMQPEYTAYLSQLGPSLSSALQAATTNQAIALSVGSYSPPADFFSTIPTSAREFYSSVWSMESQVVASAARAQGGALITPAATSAAASTTAAPLSTNTHSAAGSSNQAPALWGMAAAVGGLVAGVAAL